MLPSSIYNKIEHLKTVVWVTETAVDVTETAVL